MCIETAHRVSISNPENRTLSSTVYINSPEKQDLMDASFDSAVGCPHPQ